MDDLLEELNAICITGVLSEDERVLQEIWKEIKDLIDSYEGAVMPPSVVRAIRRAIVLLAKALAAAQVKAALKRQLDDLVAEIDALEKKKAEQELSEQEDKRLKDLKKDEAEMRRRYDEASAQLDEDISNVTNAIVPIRRGPRLPPQHQPARGRRGGLGGGPG
ncbi:TPA: hypothetical protein UOA91_002929 [Stenotrophomonas maltophilia]|nr:hypothetical protein [Stenotrophomonas maltophilia]HEL3778642.1 hypothetical protein [Stenotrophomonas maltophilia]HEL5006689.1 hypothetical protein [Stenotrophomonas maltophilia]